MNKKWFLILGIFLLFSFTFIGNVSAQPPFQSSSAIEGYQIKVPAIDILKQSQDFNLNVHVFNSSNGIPIDNSSTECVLHLYNQTGFQIIQAQIPHDTDPTVTNQWEINILGGNFSTPGFYAYIVQCNSSTEGGFENILLSVTPTGEPTNNTQLFTRVFLILLLIILVVLIQVGSKRVNYDKWYNTLTRKYQDKNYIKWGLGALAYNFMKNSWIFSYLAGLLGLLVLVDLTYFFNIESALQVLKIVFGIYTWSSIAVALIFFSQVQEWIVDWIKDLRDMNWGMEK